MRPQKRSRGRNGGGNPYHNNQNRGPRPQHRSQTFDSNGPNVKIRGNAYQVFERYLALAREAQSAGDRIAAENFFQHAEHYFRVMNAQGEGFQGQQRQQYQQTPSDPDAVNGEGDQPYEAHQGYDRPPQGQQGQPDQQAQRDDQGHNDYRGRRDQPDHRYQQHQHDQQQQHDDEGRHDDHGQHDRFDQHDQPAHVQIQQAPPPPAEPPEEDDQLPSFITGRPE